MILFHFCISGLKLNAKKKGTQQVKVKKKKKKTGDKKYAGKHKVKKLKVLMDNTL